MSIQHDYYEGLCALAVTGQIAEDEFAALEQHAHTCDKCRSTIVDFRHIAARVLPEYATKQFPLKPPPDMTARFIARARSSGIPLSARNNHPNHRAWLPAFRLVAEFACAILLVVLGSNVLRMHPRRSQTASGSQPENSRLANVSASSVDLNHQLQALEDRLNQTSRELATKQQSVEAQHSELLRLATRITNLEQADADLRRQLSERDAKLAQLAADRDQLTANLETLRSTKASEDLMLDANRSEIAELRTTIASLNDQIHDNQQLSAAAEQAKDLIVARNLHIVDVHDNAAGNRRRPFGRIFYTEGQKLIFYAYDLGESNKLNAKVTFWVWGEKSGTTEQARHLGVLHADDKRDGRWVITFDDPQVLAQINTVFVTAESPKKEPTKPSGNRILVAFLDGAPNHP